MVKIFDWKLVLIQMMMLIKVVEEVLLFKVEEEALHCKVEEEALHFKVEGEAQLVANMKIHLQNQTQT